MDVLELLGVPAGGVAFLAEAAGPVELAVGVEGLVVVGADLAARVDLEAAVADACAAAQSRVQVNDALTAGPAVELERTYAT